MPERLPDWAWNTYVAELRRVEMIEVMYHGLAFKVQPGVVSPFSVPSGLAALGFFSMPHFTGKSILEIGSGAGVHACLAASSGAAEVVGVDIAESAVKNGRVNSSSLHLTNVEFLRGDLFEPVANRHFDIVFANLPLIPADVPGPLGRALFDPQSEVLDRFVDGLTRRCVTVSRAFCTTIYDIDTMIRYPTDRRIAERIGSTILTFYQERLEASVVEVNLT